MLRVDDNLVQKLRLGALPPDQQKEAIEAVLAIVHDRVGERIADVLEPEQFVKFEKFMNKDANPEELLHWLENNIPGYSHIVDEELDKLIDEMNSRVDQAMGGK